MKRSKRLIIFIGILVGFFVILFSVYYIIPEFFGYYKLRDSVDEKYKKSWYCKDYDIGFTSDNKLFPHAYAMYSDAYINSDEIDIQILNEKFYIGENKTYKDKDSGEEYTSYQEYASGDYDYSFGNLTVTIDEIYSDKYDYLKDKTLFFTGKE